MKDSYGREIDYLRISVTDRCNLRCRYCMPEGIRLVPMRGILSYEEIAEIARAAVGLGITKFRITGGEPLVRKGVSDLIRMIRKIPCVRRVAMTTNGVLLGPFAEELRDAGLSSVNISLDTVNPVVFREITGADRLPEVLTGIDRALEAGLRVRLNCVPQKGVNDTEWDSLLALAKDRPVDVRFIEMMPIGAGRMEETVSNEALLSAIRRRYPAIRRDPAVHGDGPAVYYRIPGWQGSAGFISAIHGKFCDRCNRIRLTAQGKLKPCLCFNDAVDLREILRNTTEERRTDALKAAIREGILRKPAEHRFGESGGVTEEKFMTQIGG